MPRPAARGGTGSLSWTREFQLLHVAIRVRGDDEAVARALEFLAQDAVQPMAAARTVTFDVVPAQHGFLITDDGAALDTELDARGVMEAISRRAHMRAFAALGDATLLYVAVGSLDGSRFLLVGDSGAGVTSLAVRLLQLGAAVEGDALAVLAGGEVTAFPRPFYLRTGIERALGDLAPTLDGLPWIEGQAGDRITAWRPDRAGFPWDIRTGRIDVIFAVEANHGAGTRLSGEARVRMAQRVVDRARPRSRGGAWLGEVTRLVDGSECHRLTMGDAGAAALAAADALQ